MSRQNARKQEGVKLPFALRKELGLQEPNGGSKGVRARGRTQVADRKQRRHAMRAQKHEPQVRHDESRSSFRKATFDGEVRHENLEIKDQKTTLRQKESQAEPTVLKSSAKPSVQESRPSPKKIRVRSPTPESFESDISRASSPGLVLDASSRAFQDRAAQDDAEISALEKRLGMKKKKSLTMGDDMLDFLLDGLDEGDEGKKRKREEQDWLDGKRRKTRDLKAKTLNVNDLEDIRSSDDRNSSDETDLSEIEMEDSEADSDEATGDEDEDEVMLSEENEFDDDLVVDEEFAGFESEDDEDEAEKPVQKRVRENPYVAPVAPGASTTKYVPPSLRKRDNDSSQSLERLKRQVQGHLNKLSEANMISILGEIEKLYRTNPRQDVTESFIELILSTFSNPSALQNTFIILHAAFVTALYKVMGTDFGAEMLCKLVECFDRYYQQGTSGKEILNLISLLANLFTFNFVSSGIIYDHIRLLLSDFTESNTEYLLRVVRDCGPQLRSDDPSSLKDIVQLMHNVSADLIKSGQQPNVRTRVMMDTINDLKNNKMKDVSSAAGFTGEHITRMRKALGSLNSRTLKATEPLWITRTDIANSDKKGKWWLVGASWKGHESLGHSVIASESRKDVRNEDDEIFDEDIDFLVLAKQYGMNTDVRRSIFVAIMSATDCQDAQMRMLKLRLTNKQEQEIAKVVLRCVRAEPTYNPYYAFLTKNLCKDNRKSRISFQFALWDFFARMGEKADEDGDADDEEDQSVETHEIVNIARMYGYLIAHNYLTLGVLKTLNIGFLKEQATMFLEVLLISIMTQPKIGEDQLLKVFGRTAETPHIVKSLQYFIRKQLRRSDLVSKQEKKKVKEGCDISDVAFNLIQSADIQSE